ncbi:copper chaperone [Allomyces arbusculus]|nr:copper chaperone [Allomyces arbusculus]
MTTSSTPSVATEFAVNMTCASCEASVRAALANVPGIDSVDVSIPDKRVVVRGQASPSAMFTALRDTGLATVLRGSGAKGRTHSAVSIFEVTNRGHDPSTPYGVARLVQIAADRKGILVDVAVRNVAPGTYRVSVAETGDLRDEGKHVVDDVWAPIGEVATTRDGTLEYVAHADANVWNWIGRAMCLKRIRGGEKEDAGARPHTLCGILARSAGAFENDKVVCACSGRTLWEEKLGWVPSAESQAENKL